MVPIRVLQVVTIMNRGGLETMIMNYYRKIDRSKIQFDFIVHREERGDYDDEIEVMGGKIYRMLPIRPGNYRKYFKQLDGFFKKHTEYKVVHSHINENSGFIVKYAKKYGVKCRISHSHQSDLKIDYKYPFRLYGRYYLKNSTDFFACGEKAGKWLFGSNSEFKILNNAVDTEQFLYNELKKNRIRKELGIENKLVIGHVGRFQVQKNHTFLIDIFNEVYKRNKETALILIGIGELEEEIKEKVDSLGISKAVKFLGLRTDIADLMQAMDIFLFPSLFEGLPVVLVEAQASGLKCITSTGVTKEANITGDVEFIDLKLSAYEWAKRINSIDLKRKDYRKILIEKGYDSFYSTNTLSEFYLKNSK